MGLAACIISHVLSGNLFIEIFKNHFLYLITGAVLLAGLVFKAFKHKVKIMIYFILKHISLKLFVFLLIVILGLLSSIITAIIASLLLVEIVNLLPLTRSNKIKVNIIACFSIGLGAVLTPIGEPLSTIVVSRLRVGFEYIFQQLGLYIVPGIIVLGLLGIFYIKNNNLSSDSTNENFQELEDETYKDVLFRTFKIFIFVIALDLLGSGFKPVIDTYVIKLDGRILYWINMISAILDNATLAAAEISPIMTAVQIKAILMGLLISGGMLIPGNIPNIISAGKLKIESKEWIHTAVPIGFVLLIVYYVILFII